MRRPALALGLILALLVGPVGPAAADHGSVTFHGSGFGHGVGMSQYGARSMAVKGNSAQQILAHYYSSTRVEDLDVSGNLAVGLTTTNVVQMTVPTGSADVTVRLGGGHSLVARAGNAIRVAFVSGSHCDVTVGGTTERVTCGNIDIPLTTAASQTPSAFVQLTRRPALHDLTLGRGIIDFRQPSNRAHGDLHGRLLIRMQPYLYGLAEMPSSWPMEALKAQAIAGRTYAQRLRLDRGVRDSCGCHLVTTTSDQYYTGWAKENENSWGTRWKAAVDATGTYVGNADQLVTHNGNPITAWYSSSSAGHTEYSGDIWANDLPWASGVDDPYSVDADANNPNASWSRSPSYDQLTSRLGLASVESVSVATRNRSGSARTLEATGFAGCERTTRSVTSQNLRSWFGLPSHAISSVAVSGPGATCEWFEGDFNGDGRGDIAGYNAGTGEWVVGLSDGAGGYEVSTWNRFTTREGWEHHLVGDFTGDRKDEILSYHPDTGNWIIQISDGNSFRHEVWTRFNTRSGWSTHLVGAVERPGRDALVSFHSGTGNWVVSRGDPGRVTSSAWARYTTRSGWETHIGDVTGNELADVVNYHPSTGNWVVSRSTGSSFSTSVWARYNTRTGWTHLLADLDGDGRKDVASFHPSTGNWIHARSTGSSFQTSVWTRFNTRTGWEVHLPANVTGDLRDELVSYHPGTGNWIVTRAAGSSVRSDVWSTFPTRTGWQFHFVTDVDSDGRADVASFNRANSWWVNRSTGSSFQTSRWADLR